MVAVMAAHAPAIPRPDLWHRRFSPEIALAVVVLPFALLALWGAARPVPSGASVADDLAGAAALVDMHATAMTRAGDALSGAATASTGADRQIWIAYGEHVSADGGSLEALAARLRTTASVVAADPLHSSSSRVGGTSADAVVAYQAHWTAVRSDALAMAVHGRLMLQLAEDLEVGVGRGLLGRAEVEGVRAASSGMVDVGDRLARAAGAELAAADQMLRGMGITPR